MENIADIKAELNSANQTIKSICDLLGITDGQTSAVVVQIIENMREVSDTMAAQIEFLRQDIRKLQEEMELLKK